MATLQLATWATNLTYANLSTGVVDAAVKSLYNWAGCAIGGYVQDAPQIAQNTTLAAFSGPPTSSILGANDFISSGYADAQTAALINGIASHVDDYDDTHLETIIHPAGPVASALFAVAEWKAPVSGHDFITAFVAGVEAECKLGLSVYPEHYNVGWHITSTTGSIGAAVAVSKLLGSATVTMQNAIGIAATQVVGMQEYFGSDTKSFHVGRAAQGGMLAALLAKNNYTSSLQGLEAKFGWLHVVSTRENATAYFGQLGQIWEIEKNTFKPFPCGIVMHPSIDAAIQLHNQTIQEGKSLSDIDTVELRVNPQVLILTGKTDPQTGLEGKFSIYHATAVGLIYGEATPKEFTDAVVKNETVVDMRKKVNVTTDASVDNAQGYMTVSFKDGTKLEKHVVNAIGSRENPLTVDDLKKKFMDQVTMAIGQERATKAYDAFTNIGNLTDYALFRAKKSLNMTVVHIVLFKFRPDVTDEHKATFVKELKTLKTLPCVKAQRLVVGGPSITDPIERSKGYHFALLSFHQDRKALEEYQASAEHHRVTSTYLWPFKEDVTRFDFEVDQEDEHMWDFVAKGMVNGAA
ncbi:MmgE/PrpD family protein [Colletotrichum karsti]|uniref:MmgE/PrpD family protein n=1 Tax=Colletotrichum karsti TaxID=1095194 RepID=A0A9P6IC81_9PEZI|nr:MmgE/PrpD family protein [Colletotrichum karsti]KAF9880722.1 MmgE/PrpD family protein [Colletotrichum karsti]